MSKIKQLLVEAIEEKEEKPCLVFPIFDECTALETLMESIDLQKKIAEEYRITYE